MNKFKNELISSLLNIDLNDIEFNSLWRRVPERKRMVLWYQNHIFEIMKRIQNEDELNDLNMLINKWEEEFQQHKMELQELIDNLDSKKLTAKEYYLKLINSSIEQKYHRVIMYIHRYDGIENTPIELLKESTYKMNYSN